MVWLVGIFVCRVVSFVVFALRRCGIIFFSEAATGGSCRCGSSQVLSQQQAQVESKDFGLLCFDPTRELFLVLKSQNSKLYLASSFGSHDCI